MLSQKRILVCPLDWGLGHATRCIPIIRYLLENKATVIIAGDGDSLLLLKKEFPQLQFIYLKGYSISYAAKNRLHLKMVLSLPKILRSIVREHFQLKKIIQQYNIDTVISDNRYGLWNKGIKSIFITHQLMIKSPLMENVLHKIVLFFVGKYDYCWIPDFESAENNLSGDLSHKYKLPQNAVFIGPLSRFTKRETALNIEYDVLAIVSGPEPQRSIFEKLIINQLNSIHAKALVVCGKPQEDYFEKKFGELTVVPHLSSEQLQEAIEKSKLIIARSGYSTIMDLAVLGKNAAFIPTPGQTEQEYLAELLASKHIAFTQNQHEINILDILEKSDDYIGFTIPEKNTNLEDLLNYV